MSVLIEILITLNSILSCGGQLESLSLDKIFLPLFKILPSYEVCLVTLCLNYCSNVLHKS